MQSILFYFFLFDFAFDDKYILEQEKNSFLIFVYY